MPEFKPGDKFEGSVTFGTETYQLKDDYLWDEKDRKKIVFYEKSGNIEWSNAEWKKHR
jgi:hypothetical protein